MFFLNKENDLDLIAKVSVNEMLMKFGLEIDEISQMSLVDKCECIEHFGYIVNREGILTKNVIRDEFYGDINVNSSRECICDECGSDESMSIIDNFLLCHKCMEKYTIYIKEIFPQYKVVTHVKALKYYNSNYGDDRLCECGYRYREHFDKDIYGEFVCKGFKERLIQKDNSINIRAEVTRIISLSIDEKVAYIMNTKNIMLQYLIARGEKVGWMYDAFDFENQNFEARSVEIKKALRKMHSQDLYEIIYRFLKIDSNY